MRNIEIELPAEFDPRRIERAIEAAIAQLGLRITMRASLAKFPGCKHWHVKLGRETGTLEITLWPQARRAWFTIQSARRAPWIAERQNLLNQAIRHILKTR